MVALLIATLVGGMAAPFVVYMRARRASLRRLDAAMAKLREPVDRVALEAAIRRRIEWVNRRPEGWTYDGPPVEVNLSMDELRCCARLGILPVEYAKRKAEWS